MDEKTKSPIALMAAMLAEMAERAVEAERERDAAKKDADNWYRLYTAKDEQLKDAEAELNAVREYIDNMQKGATNNGQSNQ